MTGQYRHDMNTHVSKERSSRLHEQIKFIDVHILRFALVARFLQCSAVFTQHNSIKAALVPPPQQRTENTQSMRSNLHRLHGKHAHQKLEDALTVAFDKWLAPVAESNSPRVTVAAGPTESVKLQPPRSQPPRTVLVQPANSPWRFNTRECVQALTE